MALFSFISRPIRDITNLVLVPLKALFVVGLCGVINAMTYSGHWWVKWVAFGMGIAVVVALARGLRTLLLLALVAWVGKKLYDRYGVDARRRFDDWVAKTQPDAAGVLAALRTPASATGSAASAGPSQAVH